MNNLTLAVLLGACSPILSMESGILMEQQSVLKKEASTIIIIQNKTPDCLEILVKYSHQEELIRLRIEPNEKVPISETKKIETLYTVRYGRLLKWTNLSQLTLGLVAPYNIMEEPLLCHLINHSVNARISVKKGNKLVEALTDDSRLRWAAALISPYVYEVSAADEYDREDQDSFRTFFSYFPRAQRALHESLPILPRYFLNLPEYADAHPARAAYERARSFWKQCKNEATDPERIRLADQALRFIKAAWKSLSRGGEHTTGFNALVAEEVDAPTVYGETEWTEEKRAAWIEMGGTLEPNDSSALDPKGDGRNNNNDLN